MDQSDTPKKNVLIVDDDAAVVRALAARCQTLSVRVHTAQDAAQAVTLIRQLGGMLDLLLLDLNMPGTDGLSLCESLREDPRLEPMPVILLTGHDNEENRLRCQAAGAFFVRKDVNAWQVLEPLMRRLLYAEESTAPAPQVAYPGTVPTPLPSKTHKVLVVDDDESITRLLKARFEAVGYHVFTANGGMQGYWMALKELPDIILLDFKMPGAFGNFILGKLKTNPVTSEIPVIIISGLTDIGVQRDVLRLGAQAWINKPFRSEQVIEQVAETLR